MIDIDNKFDIAIDVQLLENITKLYTTKDIELLVVDDTKIQSLNKQNRRIDRPTDVLSFVYDDITILGSIIVSFDSVQKVAHELGHTARDELTLLYIHGLLHLVGFDHETDSGEHKTQECKIIEQFNLPDSLITRSEI